MDQERLQESYSGDRSRNNIEEASIPRRLSNRVLGNVFRGSCRLVLNGDDPFTGDRVNSSRTQNYETQHGRSVRNEHGTSIARAKKGFQGVIISFQDSIERSVRSSFASCPSETSETSAREMGLQNFSEYVARAGTMRNDAALYIKRAEMREKAPSSKQKQFASYIDSSLNTLSRGSLRDSISREYTYRDEAMNGYRSNDTMNMSLETISNFGSNHADGEKRVSSSRSDRKPNVTHFVTFTHIRSICGVGLLLLLGLVLIVFVMGNKAPINIGSGTDNDLDGIDGTEGGPGGLPLTVDPSSSPSNKPSLSPTSAYQVPTAAPSNTEIPTLEPTNVSPKDVFIELPSSTSSPPTLISLYPTVPHMTLRPSFIPTSAYQVPTAAPSNTEIPTWEPTKESPKDVFIDLPSSTSSPPTVTSLNPTVPHMTLLPSFIPTRGPSQQPSLNSSERPNTRPSRFPQSKAPSIAPSTEPSKVIDNIGVSPSLAPSQQHSVNSSEIPSAYPSIAPTKVLSASPNTTTIRSVTPSLAPSHQHLVTSSEKPSAYPSIFPTNFVSTSPSTAAVSSVAPSLAPSHKPSANKSEEPSASPSILPSIPGTEVASVRPSMDSNAPSISDTLFPSKSPSRVLTEHPSTESTRKPTQSPSLTPSLSPNLLQSNTPSNEPSKSPTMLPSQMPSMPQFSVPSKLPSIVPSISPSKIPTHQPSVWGKSTKYPKNRR